MANADDREEGEIEDGEIIESGEEGGFDPENEKRDNNNGSHSMMELLYMEMEGKDESNVKKRKKKRKRKKKTSISTELNPPKLKKPRYVDHDRIVDKSDSNLWHKTFPPNPPHAPVPHPVPPQEEERRFYNDWSPDRQSPDENNPRRPREKSPPGLYDSPYESGDDLNDGSVGNFDREFLGGNGRPGSRKNRKRKMRLDKRGGTKRRDENDNRRRNQRLPNTDTQHLICKFYLEGKCVKGDGCNYSHDISNKKMELCKFYLNGFCSKIESCIYLHNEFPCKFFHTGVECYSAENCKFSHDPLSDAMRKALDNHLAKDSKPATSPRSDGECTIQPRPHRPSLLGSPPQHIKDMVMRKKIPSLFDLEIKPPVYQPGVGTSMPPVPQGPQNLQGPPSINPSVIPGPLLPTPNDFRPNFRDDGHRAPLLPLPASSFEPDSQDYYNFDQDLRVPFNSMDPNYSNGPQSSFNPPKRYFGSDSMMDVDERYPSNGPNNSDPDNLYMKNNFDEDERVHEVIKNHEHGNPSDNQPFNPIPWRNLAVLDVDMRAGLKDDENSDSSSGNIRDFYSKFGKTNNDSNEEPFGVGLDTSLSSESEDESRRNSKDNSRSSNVVPLHLPKKQRELFMRIQQREAANKTVSDSEDSKKAEDCTGNENGPSNPPNDSNPTPTEVDEEVEKEKWYSSSEDDDDDNDQPLAAMLKKLQQQPIGKTSSPVILSAALPALPSSNSSVTVNDSSMLQLSKILQSITNKPSATVPASTPAVKKVDPRRDPRRDPRSSRAAAVPPNPITNITSAPPPVTSELRDPRSRQRPSLVSQPPLPVQPSQPSYAVNSSIISYGDNSPTQISSRLEETIPPQPVPVKSSLSRPLEHSKPKPIISRKRSSASEEEIVESHSKSSSHHLFPYKLHTVSLSLPNYSDVVHSVNKNVDPKILLCDPRLKKELANEFSVLSGASEDSSTSSSSLKKNEGSEPRNGGLHALPAAVSKVRVGQHRLGVATMPAPRMKIQSSQLKKSGSGMLITPLSLLREPPERSTTPPNLLFGNRLKEPPGLGTNSKVDKDTANLNKNTPSEEETLQKANEKEAEVKPEKVIEITSILSPNAETVSNKFEDKVIITEPEGIEESSEKEHLKEIETENTSLNSIEIKKVETIEVNKVEAIESKIEYKREISDRKMYDRMSNFDMDDSENEKSDSDLVIVEPEVEKVKKVKKSKATKKSSTKSTSVSSADKNKKPANVLVAQLGDGTCIKIKIKPTPVDNDANDSKKKETVRTPLKSKSSSSSSDNGKRATRNNKLASISSFENALNSGSSPEQKSSKKTKKPRKDEEKSSKKVSTSKSKSKKSKKQENGDMSVSMAEVKAD